MDESISQQMTLEEARKVMWLQNIPEFYKPMGVLLDEGYLTRDRLQWASEKAYNVQLRQAAIVILESLKQSKKDIKSEILQASAQVMASPSASIDVKISIEDAENTIWPFSIPPNCKGQPMGPLVKARQLVLKDLAYAAEKAWDKRVKEAATVLLLRQLDQTLNEPPAPAGPPKIVSQGRSFAEIRQLQLSLLLGMIASAVMLLPFFLFYVLLLPKMDRINTTLLQSQFIRNLILFPFRHFDLQQTAVAIKISAYAVMIAITLLPVALIVWMFITVTNRITDRMWTNINNYRKGQEGENKVVEAIISNLDGEWSLFRNIYLPGKKKTDLDITLVGPPGVWVLEVKNLAGQYENVGEDWNYRSGGRLNPLKKSPSLQAKRNAISLSDFLKADRISQYVYPAVIWANEESPLSVENPAVPVWKFNRLSEELGNIWQNQSMEKSQQAQIESKLTRLCKKRG